MLWAVSLLVTSSKISRLQRGSGWTSLLPASSKIPIRQIICHTEPEKCEETNISCRSLSNERPTDEGGLMAVFIVSEAKHSKTQKIKNKNKNKTKQKQKQKYIEEEEKKKKKKEKKKKRKSERAV